MQETSYIALIAGHCAGQEEEEQRAVSQAQGTAAGPVVQFWTDQADSDEGSSSSRPGVCR